MSERTSELYLRQLGLYDPAEHENDSVTFVGVGGIGSFAAFAAAKLGVPNIRLIDPDVAETHNVPNQMFALDQIDEPKVDAMAALIMANMGEHINLDIEQTELPNDDVILRGPVVSGLDSMKARTAIWEKHIKFNPQVPLYMDARLGGTIINLYAINPSDLSECDAYEKTLYSDEQAEEAPCTERGLIDVGFQVGAMITRALRLYFTEGESPPNITVMNQNSLWSDKGVFQNG
jgi:hypothetical protein